MNKLLSDDDLLEGLSSLPSPLLVLQPSFSTKPIVVATTWQKTKSNNSKRVVLFAIVFATRDGMHLGLRDEDEGLGYL